MATNRVAAAFANADQGVETVFSQWLILLDKVLVDEAVEQRCKTDAATLGFVTEAPVQPGFE
ncbi:MAG: hypothetical protein VBE63_13320 [Lamprobacter sp.]|uniref:hypothetical protein n=1 Tax=Lamprobacter sp. TaxID=3100796 RepID=UPI002B25AE1D|nr:hypothetical protein [Lamprobacter sp.]MEA3640910.1 hypothetical protein [Lamprobacter sp.]